MSDEELDELDDIFEDDEEVEDLIDEEENDD